MSIAGYQLVVRPPQNRFGWWGLLAATVVALVVLWWTAVGAQINGQNCSTVCPTWRTSSPA